ncbi:MAG TPA: response regulator, partial [Bacteroidales bacterium]|nr:response regulator [Bacteroidales bacterium]
TGKEPIWINDQQVFIELDPQCYLKLACCPDTFSPQEIAGQLKPAFDKFTQVYRRLNEKKLRRVNRERSLKPFERLVTQQTLQQRVMATLSHELRNPLNLILGFTELLRETGLNATQSEYAKIISDSGRGLFQTVKMVFQFLQVTTGRVVDEEMDFRLADVVKLIENQLRPIAQSKGLGWSVVLPDEAKLWLRGDMPKLHDVLYYLIENAIKFSTTGTIALKISFSGSDQCRHSFHFEIQDQGKGIDIGHQEEIFQFFSQEDDSITRNYGGLGLGLSLARLFVEHLGGFIELQSAKDQGTRFNFRLCFSECSNHKATDQGLLMPDPAITKNIDILIVDDDPYQRKMAAHILRNWKLSFAASGKQAIDSIRKNPEIGIVLMDIRMPDMDGITATRIIRNELNSKAAIIAVSGEALEATMEECFEAGMDAFVSKPFDPEQLMRTILLHCDALHHIQTELIRNRPVDKLSGLKALLVEDNKMIQLLTMRYLRDLECKAELAHDVESALLMTSAGRHDFILLDLQLPDGTGFEVARHVRKTDENVCIIAYSGEDSEQTLAECKLAGINGLILKSYNTPQELAIKINRLIDEHRQGLGVQQPVDAASMTEKDFNLSMVKEIVGENKPDLILLLEIFVEYSGTTLNQLLAANRTDDLGTIARHAHSLKSSAKQFGMDRAAELLFALEQRTGQLDSSQRIQMCNELEAIFGRTMPALIKEIEKLKT